jgi:hypothetical protein
MTDDEKNLLVFGEFPRGTIEIQPHPEEVIDVRPEILAVMKARLNGESLDHLYSPDDRVSNGLLIDLERRKLKAVFGSPEQVLEAFSSLKNIKAVRQELRAAGLAHELLSEYSLKKNHGDTVDEADVYINLLTRQDLSSKKCRLQVLKESSDLSREARRVLKILGPYYTSTHFSPLLVTREMVQVSKELQGLFRKGPFVEWMDELLGRMYGRSA